MRTFVTVFLSTWIVIMITFQPYGYYQATVIPIEKVASLKDPLMPWASVFAMEENHGKIYFSLQQGFRAGYGGMGGIYSIDPETLDIQLEFPYSAAGAWWAEFPGASIGGCWGHVSVGDNVLWGGYAINDINAVLVNIHQRQVKLLPDWTYEIWSLAEHKGMIYAGTSFDIYVSSDLQTWVKLPGTSRRLQIMENVIWDIEFYNDTLYCISNFLYRYDFNEGRLVELHYNIETNTLKSLCVWRDKLWFSGFSSSLNENRTWLMSYDPATGATTQTYVPANSIIDIIEHNDCLWLAGYTGPRILGEHMHGNVGLLFRYDGETLEKIVEMQGCNGFVGLAGFDKYIYFGTFTGEVYRISIANL
ncbi:MAG: hypothetical protein QXX08_09585 [Candidatus Bathyarchaeia archaeon]